MTDDLEPDGLPRPEDLKPDPHERVCPGCKMTFNPWSMDLDDHATPVAPPKDYICLSCRTYEGMPA